jgi:hypothetical protein
MHPLGERISTRRSLHALIIILFDFQNGGTTVREKKTQWSRHLWSDAIDSYSLHFVEIQRKLLLACCRKEPAGRRLLCVRKRPTIKIQVLWVIKNYLWWTSDTKKILWLEKLSKICTQLGNIHGYAWAISMKFSWGLKKEVSFGYKIAYINSGTPWGLLPHWPWFYWGSFHMEK